MKLIFEKLAEFSWAKCKIVDCKLMPTLCFFMKGWIFIKLYRMFGTVLSRKMLIFLLPFYKILDNLNGKNCYSSSGPRSTWLMNTQIQTIFVYENSKANQNPLWFRLWLVQSCTAYKRSLKSFCHQQQELLNDENYNWHELKLNLSNSCNSYSFSL